MPKKTTDRLSLPVPGKMGVQLAAVGLNARLVIEGPLSPDDVAKARAMVSTVATWEKKTDAALRVCASLAPVERTPSKPARKSSKR
jgi:hypothetical protein